MKKIALMLSAVICSLMVVGLAACSNKTTTAKTTTASGNAGATTTAAETKVTTNASGKAEIAVVTDVGQLMDGGFNQGTYEGVKNYAEAHSKTYAYYQPANGANATDNDRVEAMELAIENGAKVIVAPGYLQYTAMAEAAENNPDVKFIFVDGWNFGASNVTAISYKEQESGFFAGYAAVMEGYTKLAGVFGGAGGNPACNRFAWGYIQGINAAAKAKNNVSDIDVKVSWNYGSSFSASAELQTMVSGWYTSGTEVVFSCGGSMVNSVLAAANETENGKVIGVDTDQASLSERIITSAFKGLAASVQLVLDEYYAGEWDAKLADKTSNLGVNESATGLPTAEGSWRFTNFTVDAYNTLLASVKDGSLVVSADVPASAATADAWATQLADISVKVTVIE